MLPTSNLRTCKLRNCLKNSLPQCTFNLTFKLTNCLSSLFWFKDVVLKELQSHLVSKLSCCNCNFTYYGKTERYITVRFGEHIVISHLIGKTIQCKWSSVSDHF